MTKSGSIRRTGSRARRLTPVLVSAALVALLAGCGQPAAQPGVAQAPTTPRPTAVSSSSPTAEESEDPGRNDLASGTARRVIRSGGLVFSLSYSSSEDPKTWRADHLKPLKVALSVGTGGAKQKVYLSRATLNVVPSDPDGPTDAPKAIGDTANINPGYLVNLPYSYEQNFLLPTVDPGTSQLAVTLNFELLYQVGSKDYAKLNLSDDLVVPVS